MTRTLAFVRFDQLTDEQRRLNIEAQAKVSQLATERRKVLK